MAFSSIRRMVVALTVVAAVSTAIGCAALAQVGDFDVLEKEVANLYDKGNYKGAAALARRLVGVAKDRHGTDHVNYAAAISWQALASWQQGQYPGVEPLLKHALATFEKAYGPEHIKLANALNNLGNFLQVLGHFDEAEPLMRRALEMDEKLLGGEHPSVGRDCSNLGLMYVEQGRFAEAEPLLLRALAISEKTLAEDHPSRTIRLRNLAVLYREQARYADAEPLLRRSLHLNEVYLGKEHSSTAQSLGSLGRLYREMGRYREAEAHHKRSIAIRKKLFGRSSLPVADSLNSLAVVYRDLGQLSDAEQLANRALAIREQSLGPEHYQVALSLALLAGIHESGRRLDDAEQLYRRVLAIQQKKLRPDHPDLANTQANLGGLYTATGQYALALPLLEAALATRQKVLGENHPAFAASLVQLAELHRLEGRREDSENLLRRARAVRRSGIRELPIFFATDRKREARGSDVRFTKEIDADKVTLGATIVSVVNAPPAENRARPVTGKRGTDVDESTDVGRISLSPVKVYADTSEMIEAARERLSAASLHKSQVLLFVHGYNMSFDDGIRRAGQIAYDLDFDGPTFAFSWPSRQRLFGYLEDREMVDIATEHLREFLQSVLAELKPDKVHLIAHSMGNLVLLRALAGGGTKHASWAAIGEIISAAPDVDPVNFRRFASRIKEAGGRLTVYASAADWALRISSWFRSRPRVGYVMDGKPIMTPGVDTIDITKAGMSLFAINHDIYASSPVVIGDMRRLLKGERPPDRRTEEFLPRAVGSGKFWYYEPPVLGAAPQ
jgi:esterase/lipase superfamily enzyme/Tfp pilus assembly protein PilF